MNFVFHPLTLVTFFPLVGVLVLLFLEAGAEKRRSLDGFDHLTDYLWHFDCCIAAVRSE